jgi:hypothetical protein
VGKGIEERNNRRLFPEGKELYIYKITVFTSI